MVPAADVACCVYRLNLVCVCAGDHAWPGVVDAEPLFSRADYFAGPASSASGADNNVKVANVQPGRLPARSYPDAAATIARNRLCLALSRQQDRHRTIEALPSLLCLVTSDLLTSDFCVPAQSAVNNAQKNGIANSAEEFRLVLCRGCGYKRIHDSVFIGPSRGKEADYTE